MRGKCILKNGICLEEYGKPYIVAEVNSSHNGKLDLAMDMVKKAKEIGCNAVKFQSWSAESLYSKDYYNENPIAHRMVSRFAMTPESLKRVAEYSKEIGIDFSSTPYSKEEVDYLVDECEANFVKIASMDINNLPFLRYVAKKGIAIILSTGMATMDEIRRAVGAIEEEGNHNICILHCVSVYPVELRDANLLNILELKEQFPNYPIGYSDHTIGELAATCAVAMGCPLIEKHFTLDNSRIGWDNQMATEPDGFRQIVENSKSVFDSFGARERSLSTGELEQRDKMRRSVVAGRTMEAGTILSMDMLDYKRPGTGVAPDQVNLLVGKTLNRDVQKDEMIKLDDVRRV